jgi:hypothetical protein
LRELQLSYREGEYSSLCEDEEGDRFSQLALDVGLNKPLMDDLLLIILKMETILF